ncbi:hypothetical protein ACS0TY_032642 [Phlomoides rotata]
MESVDDIVGKAVWGGDKVEWAYREAVGRAGGIISLWDSDEFACSSSWNMEGAVIVNGFWKEDGTRCCVVNVYAPCQVTAKMEFWDRILSIIDQEADSRICILGDFNSIRNDSKREGRRAGSCRRDVMAFDSFIRDSGGKKGKKVASTIWECIVWQIWRSRNARIFKDEEQNMTKTVENIKSRLWSWFASKEIIKIEGAYKEWTTNPKIVLGM